MNSADDNLPSSPNRKRRRLRILAWAVAWAVTLAVLGIVVENWLGARAWLAYVKAATAAGERLEPEAIVPAHVPDAENFAAIPLFKPLFDFEHGTASANDLHKPLIWRDPAAKERLEKLKPFGGADLKPVDDWRQGQFVDMSAWAKKLRGEDSPEPGKALLLDLARFDPELEALRAGASRPQSRFPINYEDHVGARVLHLPVLRTFAAIGQMRALAELSLNDSEAALRDILLGLRLADAVSTEPILISQLVQIAQIELLLPPLWEGLVRHQWNDAQLAAIDAALAKVDLVSGFQRAVRGERTLLIVQALDALKKQPHFAFVLFDSDEHNDGQVSLPARAFSQLVPSGWVDFNKAHLGPYYDRLIKTADPTAHRFLPERAMQIEQEFKREIAANRFNPHKILAALLFPAVVPALERCAATQATLDLARCAVAIERHRLKHGVLPSKLAALVPTYLTEVPHDVMSGEPLHYQPGPHENQFLLYSVGWNGQNDGGKYAWKPDSEPARVDWQKGDWPWPQRSDER